MSLQAILEQHLTTSQVIERFKQGEFNVLVATSIGEEGLDIGEIDLIVCYDVQKTPIRMVSAHQHTLSSTHLSQL